VSAAANLSEGDGSSVGKYKFIASLGHGGMADVYLAVVSGPAGFNKLQVVKRLRRDLVEDPEHIEMFLDEARLAARLNHPNVVQTFEVSESGGEYFMAMEYLEGIPFNRLISRAKTTGASRASRPRSRRQWRRRAFPSMGRVHAGSRLSRQLFLRTSPS